MRCACGTELLTRESRITGRCSTCRQRENSRTSMLASTIVGASTDSAVTGAVVGTVLGGDAVSSVMGGILGDVLNGGDL
jgi:hypothetical protein